MIFDDLMLNKKYAELYLKTHEEIFEFEYKENDEIFKSLSIKRPIKEIGNIKIEENYFDLETPYGYGGLLFNTKNKNFIKKALKEYKNFCKEKKIIANFIRFHPFVSCISEEMDFCSYDRDIVIKDLSVSNDILSTYSSKVRNIIKKCSTKNIQIRESRNIDKFLEMYYFTMEKNKADKFYYFDKDYFKKLLQLENVFLYEAVFENEVIAMSFFIFSTFAYYHLSANTPISYKLNANYLLLHYAFLEAKKRGIKYFILGGGTSSFKDDTLLKFKMKFSKLLKPFYIGGIIFNKDKYTEYNKLWMKQSNKDIKYFLKYRLEV